ncbi:MAG: hypothetical protein IPH05_16620 [Flavobacteriales bacterium]|nr:hypothetical protein [Flavobacteriales bacterium]MBK6548877.1 hypothetical protein [Flavobacteriales bacterium]MBK6884526.1 hypothetical protein [Flavobacteriales bacterium]MBK7100926.1 hypothetical protein [Flavobacteriales bacterium]MBK8532742.1 hypothetical protein [Flavobacteriales bacterium]
MNSTRRPSSLRFCLVIFIALVVLPDTSVHAQTLNTDWWHTAGGSVSAMVPSTDGSVIYMAGSFNYIGPVVTYGALLDLELGQPTLGLPMPNGTVECSVPDGAGGWYIGGVFSEVGGEARSKVAHIDANGALNSWQVDVGDGTMMSLFLDGSTLYMSGTFITVAGETRSGVAAVNAMTGALLPFAPVLGDAFFPRAKAMAVVGSTLIMGGKFGSVNGVQRNYLAAVDKVTGELASWNPNPSSEVFAMRLSEDGGTVHIGGSFTTIASQSRTRTAAFNTSTFSLLPWTVAASSAVRAMDIEGDIMVLGGEFTTLGGLPRENLGAVDLPTGSVLDWVADTDEDVLAVALHDNVVHVGGDFTEIGGMVRRHIAAVDMTSSAVTDWDPVSGSDIYTLTVSGSKIFAGGWYTSIGGKVRNKLMAMDPVTGRPTDWDAGAVNDYGSISDLALSPDGQVLYGSGSFNEMIGGQQRKHLVALDVNTALALPWGPRPDQQVSQIELSPDGSVLYAAGYFSAVDGVQRSSLAAFNADPQQTELLPWDPNCTAGSVVTMALSSDGSTLYVGGSFRADNSTIGGQPRDRIAALSTSMNTNNATAWTAPLAGPVAIGTSTAMVYSLLLDPTGENLYIGGHFQSAEGHTVSGEPRDALAAVSTITGAALPWNPGANDRISELKWSGHGELMITGVFEGAGAIGGQDRQGFAYVDPVSGVVGPFSATFNFGGYGIDAEEFGDLLILSGFFAEVNGQVRLSLAAFNLPPTAVLEHLGSGSYQVRPNPTADELWLPTLSEARTVEVLDALGRSVIRTNYQPVVHLGKLPTGPYFLQVRDQSGQLIMNSKVIVER